MLNAPIRSLLEKKYGRAIRYPKDCEALSAMIRTETGGQVSASTLKRLLGFYKEIESPRLYTLDTIAMFLGYADWADAQSQMADKVSSAYVEDEIISGLGVGAMLTLKYTPDRLIVMKCLGNRLFEILESNSLHLMRGDRVELPSVIVNYPLVCTNVYRENKSLGQYIGARNGGVQSVLVMSADGNPSV